MKYGVPPNGFFGNGPSNGDDSHQKEMELEAYKRSRLQFTVASSTFAGVAIVGMFCSCLWFFCCRHSSKTRKKGRTWANANAEAGLENPYNYDGYMDSQGYGQVHTDGVAPYMNNPLYPSTMYGDNGLTNAYDFNEHFGFNQGGKTMMTGVGGLNSALQCGTTDIANMKDVPPSYTALFFASSDPNGVGAAMHKKAAASFAAAESDAQKDPRVTSIQPIHLKVTSHTNQVQKAAATTDDKQEGAKMDHDKNDFADYLDIPENSSAPPESLVSVESDPGTLTKSETKPSDGYDSNKDQNEGKGNHTAAPTPPSYNPGYSSGFGYQKF